VKIKQTICKDSNHKNCLSSFAAAAIAAVVVL